MDRVYKGRPPRLAQVFQRDGWPLYFVTMNTWDRSSVLACPDVHHAFCNYGENGLALGAGMGRYVIMPDHIHVFVRIAPNMTLKRWSSGLKRVLGVVLTDSGLSPRDASGYRLKSFWQPGFFDHLLRHNESYVEKWDYVRQNPVRAGLVEEPDDWPYQGEITRIDRV
ncbi:MAG: hypothetical protein HN341_09180 [Verrucomicrobia bacterium]|jgi:putative transposase|nr:hypothetical protein [Verrucomicrobiota bacterium]